MIAYCNVLQGDNLAPQLILSWPSNDTVIGFIVDTGDVVVVDFKVADVADVMVGDVVSVVVVVVACDVTAVVFVVVWNIAVVVVVAVDDGAASVSKIDMQRIIQFFWKIILLIRRQI